MFFLFFKFKLVFVYRKGNPWQKTLSKRVTMDQKIEQDSNRAWEAPGRVEM